MKNYDNESFVSLAPSNSRVSKHIAYYYFHDCPDIDFKRTYVYYPHIRNALTVYQNQKADIKEDHCIYTPTAEKSSTVYYARNLKSSIRVEQNGPLHKTGVVFNPLGINNFVKGGLYDLSKEVYGAFTHYDGELAALCQRIIPLPPTIKVQHLDRFFEAKLCAFDNSRIQQCLDMLHDSRGEIRVSQMAQNLNLSRKTLYREFQTHLCSSIEAYRGILRFRLALDHYYRFNKPTMTKVVYENGFYDQPSFINHFKKVTGYRPRTFFENLTRLSDNDIYWTLFP